MLASPTNSSGCHCTPNTKGMVLQLHRLDNLIVGRAHHLQASAQMVDRLVMKGIHRHLHIDDLSQETGRIQYHFLGEQITAELGAIPVIV